MGETSLNGWAAIQDENDPRLRWIQVPGTNKKVCIRKEAAPLFACILAEINKKLIPLDGGPLDGWEYRTARQSNALSNHSSASAVDFRYDVLLADNELHWPQSKHDIMHKLMDKYVTTGGKRVFGWGGDWTPGRSADEMHIELIQSWSPGSQGSSCTLADVQNVIKRLGIKDDGTQSIVGTVIGKLPAPKPMPTPAPKPATKLISLAAVKPNLTNNSIKLVQAWLALAGCNPGAPDGAFGPKTKAAYAAWQRKCGYSGADADGVPGKTSLSKLADLHGYTVVA